MSSITKTSVNSPAAHKQQAQAHYRFKPLNLGRIVVWGLFALALIGVPACAYGVDGTVMAANAELVTLLGRDPCGAGVDQLFTLHVREASVALLASATPGEG